MRNFSTKKVVKVVLIGLICLYAIVKIMEGDANRPPYYIDGKHVVMIDYNATEQDWNDAYLQWKAMRAADSYNRR